MKRTRKGFTLVELLVVIAILAILATVSVVGYTSFINRANDSNAATELHQIQSYINADLMADNKWEYKLEDGTEVKVVKNSDGSLTVVQGATDLADAIAKCPDLQGLGSFADDPENERNLVYTASNGKGEAIWEGVVPPPCTHADADNDHICDSCESVISTCSGGTATCTEKATCDICGEKYGEVDADNHNVVDGLCNRDGCDYYDEAYRAYYLVGYINGADYGCEDDDANTGIYKFVDGKLTVTFEKDSYVFVKSVNANGDNIGWFMAESLVTGKQATLTTGKTEKMLVPGGVTITFTLTNNNGTFTLDADYEGKLLYLKPNANWKADGARFAAYYFNSTTDYGWVDMASDGEYYRVLIPDGYANVIFCRMNPSATANNWSNKWTQTSDLTVPTNGNNLYTINDGSWDAGTWSTK